MENNHSHPLITIAGALVALVLADNIREVRQENEDLKSHVTKLEKRFSKFTNPSAQEPSSTNLAYQTESTNTPTYTNPQAPLSQRTPRAINYAEKLNQAQTRGIK